MEPGSLEEYDEWKDKVSPLSFIKNFKGILEYIQEAELQIFKSSFSAKSIRNWEHGKYLPNFNSVKQMLEMFGFSSVYEIFPLHEPSSIADKEWRDAVREGDIQTLVEKLKIGRTIEIEKVECYHCNGKGFKTSIRACS